MAECQYVKADDEDSAIDEALDMVAEDFGLSVRDAILDGFDIILEVIA